MTRFVLAVDLKDDAEAIASYRAHHERVWPEVIESLTRAGVRAMDIYLLGRRLVMVVDTDGTDFRQSFEQEYSDLDVKLNNAYAAWDNQQIKIKASCGVHMYSAQAEVAELLEAADAAMYKIKQERRAKFGIKAR